MSGPPADATPSPGDPDGGGAAGTGSSTTPQQRRRRLQVAAGLLALAVVGGALGVAIAIAANDDDPSTAETTPSGTSSSPDTSTSEPTTPSETTTTTTTTAQTTAPAPGPTTIPADLSLPHEGAPADGDFSAWEEADWSYDPCSARTAAYPSFERAGQARHIVQTGPEFEASETLIVMRTTADAEAFMGELRAAGAPCPVNDADGPTRASITPVDGDWGDGFVHAVAYEYLDAPGTTAASAYLMAVRHGRAVVMTTVAGEFVAPVQGDQPAPAAVEELRATPDTIASKLCIYTEEGC